MRGRRGPRAGGGLSEVVHAQFHALLVEGTSGIGKSTLIDALLRRYVEAAPQRKLRSLLHLAQTHTYGPLVHDEDRGTLTIEANCRHLDSVVSTLEWLHDAHDHSHVPSFTIVDTLHLTQCVRPGVIGWSDAAPFDLRLAAIGCRMVLLLGSRATLRTRSIDARQGTQFIDYYAVRFGRNPGELADYFANEQDRLDEMAGRSALSVLRLDADQAPSAGVDAAFAFWQG
jgi:hypothetical protein